MSTITLKDYANVDVVFSLIGSDLTNARFSALSLNDSDSTVDLVANQQRVSLGSKASHRATIKVAHEDAAVGSSGAVTVTRQSVSTMFTIPPGGTLARTKDEWAFLRAYIDANIEAIYNGIV